MTRKATRKRPEAHVYAPPTREPERPSTGDEFEEELDESAWDVWREGVRLIARQRGQLPKRCVRCNRRTQRRLTVVLRKYPAWIRIFWLISPPIMLLLYVVGLQRAQLTVGICSHHYRRWETHRLIRFGLVASLLLFYVAITAGEARELALGGFVIMLVAWLVTASEGHLLELDQQDAEYVWVIPSYNFLESFEDEEEEDADDEDWEDESDA